MGANSKIKFILGSQSPRRKELVSWLNIPYEIISPEIDEEAYALTQNYQTPQAKCVGLAEAKLNKILENLPYSSAFILCADTNVSFDGVILEKPSSSLEAKSMLQSLSGRSHVVSTGVCLALVSKEGMRLERFVVTSLVEFAEIDDITLDLYVSKGEALDKAGAYGIQGEALSFIKSIDGSYSNVVGLPINEVREKITHHFGMGDRWREKFI